MEKIVSSLRNSFGHGRVLVVGDIMLDRYVWGSVDRVSPEAPAPILRERRHSIRAGGAGNVALNLAGLDLQVSLAGFVGDDVHRHRLLEIFARHEIDTSALVTLSDRPTITKTRLIAGHQQMIRLDEEDVSEIKQENREHLRKAVLGTLDFDAIVVSDYSKGAAMPSFCRQLIEAARHSSAPVLVKPGGPDISHYAGARVLTSNLSMLSRAAGVPADSPDDLVDAARTFVDQLELEFFLLTQGRAGMTLVAHDQTIHSPARAREVFDVSGAGDTVIAAIAAAMIAGLDYAHALHLANLAAGVVVGQIGTVAIDRAALLRVIQEEERASAEILQNMDELLPLVEGWRSNNRRVVYVEGLFDGVYANDVHFLQNAASEGDKLVVGLARCKSTKVSGGRSQSLDDQLGRAKVVASLKPVDAVVLCDATNSSELIDLLKPDVVLVGEGR